jgi:hypothetical protein
MLGYLVRDKLNQLKVVWVLFCIGSSVNKVWDILWIGYNPRFQNTRLLLPFFYVMQVSFAYFIRLCNLFFGLGFLPCYK